MFLWEANWVPFCFLVIIHISTQLMHSVRILQQLSGIQQLDVINLNKISSFFILVGELSDCNLQ